MSSTPQGQGLMVPLSGLVGANGEPLNDQAKKEAAALRRGNGRALTEQEQQQMQQVAEAQTQHIEMYASAYLRFAPQGLHPKDAMLIQQQNQLTGEIRWFFHPRETPPIPRPILDKIVELIDDAARNGGRSKAAQLAREIGPDLKVAISRIDVMKQQADAEAEQQRAEMQAQAEAEAAAQQESPAEVVSAPESNAFGLRAQSIDDDDDKGAAVANDAEFAAFHAGLPDELLSNQERQARRHASGDRWV